MNEWDYFVHGITVRWLPPKTGCRSLLVRSLGASCLRTVYCSILESSPDRETDPKSILGLFYWSSRVKRVLQRSKSWSSGCRVLWWVRTRWGLSTSGVWLDIYRGTYTGTLSGTRSLGSFRCESKGWMSLTPYYLQIRKFDDLRPHYIVRRNVYNFWL